MIRLTHRIGGGSVWVAVRSIVCIEDEDLEPGDGTRVLLSSGRDINVRECPLLVAEMIWLEEAKKG